MRLVHQFEYWKTTYNLTIEELGNLIADGKPPDNMEIAYYANLHHEAATGDLDELIHDILGNIHLFGCL